MTNRDTKLLWWRDPVPPHIRPEVGGKMLLTLLVWLLVVMVLLAVASVLAA